MLSVPLKEIDTFGEGKNKLKLFSCYSTFDMGKLLPAVGAQMPSQLMMSHNGT